MLIASSLGACAYPVASPAPRPTAQSISSLALYMQREESRLPDAPLPAADIAEYREVSYAATGATLGAAAGSTAGAVLPTTSSEYGTTPVAGDRTVSQFYYIRQDHYLHLVPPGANLQGLVAYRTFGPHPIGAEVYTRLGYNYYFIPVCGGVLAAGREVEVRADEPPPPFRLTCSL
jgi:hypothetical protein